MNQSVSEPGRPGLVHSASAYENANLLGLMPEHNPLLAHDPSMDQTSEAGDVTLPSSLHSNRSSFILASGGLVPRSNSDSIAKARSQSAGGQYATKLGEGTRSVSHHSSFGTMDPAMRTVSTGAVPRHDLIVHASAHGGNMYGSEAVPQPPRNPILQVSDEYMRIFGVGRRPFRKFLARRQTLELELRKKASASSAKANGMFSSSVEERTPLRAGDLESAAGAAGGGGGGGEHIGHSGYFTRMIRANQVAAQRQANYKYRLGLRKKLHQQRNRFCDYSMLFAFMGIALTILDCELCANGFAKKEEALSLFLRSLVLSTTVGLMVVISCYHGCEVQLSVIDSGADDWRVAITWQRIAQVVFELFVCVWGPIPGTTTFHMPFVFNGTPCASCNYTAGDPFSTSQQQLTYVDMPLDVPLTVPMFLRSYLISRYMVLHSHQFRDAATRSIAALNRVSVDFRFVLKTLMVESPLLVLIVFAVGYWVSVSWVYTICERNATKYPEQEMPYLTSLWFVVITFMTIGYGDIVPNTYCGRTLAVTTAVVGAGVSSALIAVIGRKLDLTKAEKHVNAFMADTKLAKERKNAAASVLQETWFIYKYRYLQKNKADDMKIRLHQRRFLAAITEFRRVKWEQRKLTEQSNMLVDIAKVQADMSEVLWELQQSHKSLLAQLNSLNERLQEIQGLVAGTPNSPKAILATPGGSQPATSSGTPVPVPRKRTAEDQHFRLQPPPAAPKPTSILRDKSWQSSRKSTFSEDGS